MVRDSGTRRHRGETSDTPADGPPSRIWRRHIPEAIGDAVLKLLTSNTGGYPVAIQGYPVAIWSGFQAKVCFANTTLGTTGNGSPKSPRSRIRRKHIPEAVGAAARKIFASDTGGYPITRLPCSDFSWFPARQPGAAAARGRVCASRPRAPSTLRPSGRPRNAV